MTTYNTGNALGSSDARDLYDNAENIDNFANGTANTYQDRLGVTRKSLAGMNAAFDDFIESSGYTVPVAYTSGIALSEYNQLIEYNDEFYKLKAGQAPYTTTGTWEADSAKLVAVGDAALRQELLTNANDFNLIPEVANYAAVRAGLGDLEVVYVRGRENIFDGGAGIFRLKAGDTTTDDNDGTVLVDSVSGARYFREYTSPVYPQWFGARGNGFTDDTAASNAAVDYLVSIGGGWLYFPPGIYIVSQPVKLRSRIRYSGAGKVSVIKQKPGGVACNLFGESSPATPATHILVEDLAFDGSRAEVEFPADDGDGNAIRLNQVSRSRFDRLYISDTVFNAVSVYNLSNDNVFSATDISDVGKLGALPPVYTFNGFFFEAGSSRNKVLFPRINVTRQYGVWIGARDADNYDNEIVCPWIASTLGDGIRIGDEATSNVCHRPKIVSPTVLAAGDVGIRAYHAGSGGVQDLEITGGIIEGSANRGILLDAAVSRARVRGTRLQDNGAHNITIVGSDCSVDVEASGASVSDVQDVGTRTKIIGGSNVASGREGVFTPVVLTGGAADGRIYSAQHAMYKVVGNLVEFKIVLTLTAKGTSTGNLTIGGLPFISKSSGAFATPRIGVAQLTYSGTPFGLVLNNSTEIVLYTQSSASPSTPMTDVNLSDSSEFYIDGSYII